MSKPHQNFRKCSLELEKTFASVFSTHLPCHLIIPMSNPSLQTRIWLRFADNPYRSQTVRNVRYGCLRAARGLLCVLGPLVVCWCKSRRHFKQPSGPSDLLWNEQIFDISIVGHSDPTHSPTDHNGVRRHEKRCLWPVDSVSEYFCNIRGWEAR